jgi:tetratricopeptide (TPR) repeat protein
LFAALALVAGFGCSQTTESRLTEVQALQQIGDYSSSIAPLRKILAQEPDHPRANFLLGLALIQTRQPTLAVWPLRKAADSDEHQIIGGVLLASALLQTEGFEEAIEASNTVVELEPDNIAALLLRADASLSIGQTEKALADSETILELDPEHPRAWGTKGQALLRLDRFEESEGAWLELERILGDTGDPGQAVRGCLAVARFHELRESEAFEPKLEACLDEYPSEAIVLQVASNHYNSTGRHEESIAVWRRAVEEEPDRIDLRAQLGAHLSNQGRLEEAEAAMVEAAELFDDVQTWNRLSIFYQTHAQPEKALAAIERSLARSSNAPELRFRQADLLVELDRLEEAEAIAEELEEEVYRHLLHGRVLVARGQDRAALDALEAGLTRWPNNAYARFLAGRVAEGLGLRDKAVAHYREAVRGDPKATDAALWAALLEIKYGNYRSAGDFARAHTRNRGFTGPEAHTVAARSAIALGEFERARATLEDLRLRPGMESTELVERAALERRAQGPEAAAKVIEESELDLSDPAQEAMLRSLVDDLVTLGRIEEAIARIERAVAKNPDSADHHDLLGRVLYLTGRTEEALQHLERAIEKDPSHARALTVLARLALADGRVDEALARHLERAIEQDPSHAPALTVLARLALADGRVDEALARAEAAVAADASYPEAAYLSTQILSQQGRADESRARLRALVKDHPAHVGAANDLAWLLAVEGEDLDDALALAERAARLQPVANIFDTLGWVQLKRGDAAAAVQSFESALEIDPSASSIRYRYGLALEELGRSDEAMGALREALGTGPFPEAEAARAEVARLEARSR